MKRRYTGALTAIGGVFALGIGLAAIDDRVRAQITHLASGTGPSSEIVSISARVQDLAFVALNAVRDQSFDHAPLVIFALAAMVLVLFMLRT